MRISDWSSDVCSSDLESRGRDQNGVSIVPNVISASRPTGMRTRSEEMSSPALAMLSSCRRMVADLATAVGNVSAVGALANGLSSTARSRSRDETEIDIFSFFQDDRYISMQVGRSGATHFDDNKDTRGKSAENKQERGKSCEERKKQEKRQRSARNVGLDTVVVMERGQRYRKMAV